MVYLRDAREEDIPRLLEIYTPYVQATAITFEYTVPTAEEFKARWEKFSRDFPYLVVEDKKGTILAYAYAHRYNERMAYSWTVETSIYVDLSARGKGIGSLLYAELEERLKEQGIRSMIALVVPMARKGSYEFHKKMGFTERGVLKKAGYKFNSWHDVVIFQKMIGDFATELQQN